MWVEQSLLLICCTELVYGTCLFFLHTLYIPHGPRLFFPNFVLFSTADARLREDQDRIVKQQVVDQMGRDMCQTIVIFLYLHPKLSSLSLCLLWQRMFSDQFRVALAFAPSLYFTHSGCSCVLPDKQRHKGRIAVIGEE